MYVYMYDDFYISNSNRGLLLNARTPYARHTCVTVSALPVVFTFTCAAVTHSVAMHARYLALVCNVKSTGQNYRHKVPFIQFPLYSVILKIHFCFNWITDVCSIHACMYRCYYIVVHY